MTATTERTTSDLLEQARAGRTTPDNPNAARRAAVDAYNEAHRDAFTVCMADLDAAQKRHHDAEAAIWARYQQTVDAAGAAYDAALAASDARGGAE